MTKTKVMPRYSAEELQAMRDTAVACGAVVKAVAGNVTMVERKVTTANAVTHTKPSPRYTKLELAQMRAKAMGKELGEKTTARYSAEDIEKMRDMALATGTCVKANPNPIRIQGMPKYTKEDIERMRAEAIALGNSK